MLKLLVQSNTELYDEETETFLPQVNQLLLLEHSLFSISKWESIYKKPFLTSDVKSRVEIKMYVKCMTLNEEVEDYVYDQLTEKDFKTITDYIDDPHTATTIKTREGPPNREIYTSEVIYYYMVSATIPFECQYWHLNRLLTLISVYSIKNQEQNGKQKMSKADVMKRNTSINAARRQAMNTKG